MRVDVAESNVACYAVLMRANEPETDSVCPQLHCSTMFVKISWISFTSLTNLSLISLTSLTHLPHISHPSPSHLSLISFTSLTHLPHISHSSPSHLSPISLTSLIHLPLSLISLRILNFKRQLYSICDCEWEKGHLPHFIVFYFSTLLDCSYLWRSQWCLACSNPRCRCEATACNARPTGEKEFRVNDVLMFNFCSTC